MSRFVFFCVLTVTLVAVARCKTTTTVEYNYFNEPELPIFLENSTARFCEFLAEQSEAGTLYQKQRMLYIEIFSMASGFRHKLPNSDGMEMPSIRDRDLQMTAVASTFLWNKLAFMEDLDNIFHNASWNALVNMYKRGPYVSNHIFHYTRNDMFKTIENVILANATMASIYQEERNKADKLTIPPSKVVNFTIDQNPEFDATTLRNFPRIQAFDLKITLLMSRFGVCLYEMLHKNRTDSTRINVEVDFADPKVIQVQALSEGVLRWAKTNKVDRAQKILDQAIEDTRMSFPYIKDSKLFVDTFFDKLESEFMKHPEFKSELEALKEDFTKKYFIKEQ